MIIDLPMARSICDLSERSPLPNLYKIRWISIFTRLLCAMLLSATVLSYPNSAFAENDGNCLLCHKLKGLVAVDEKTGRAQNLTVDEELYRASYHGRVNCNGCHVDINRIPHGEVKKVNCAVDCHIRDPSTNSRFSHSNAAKSLSLSAHGGKSLDDKSKQDLPVCKDCHQNKPYQKVLDDQHKFEQFTKVCLQCHESIQWIERFYRHMNYRTSIRRSSKEIVKLCSQCHADGAMMGRHDLDVVVGFNDTFHGKAIQYGNTEVANCINCHAPYGEGFSPHSIMSKDHIDSPVSTKNKIVTCRQSDCHVGANDAFASSGKVHPSSYGMVSWLRPKQSTVEALNIDQSETDLQKLIIYLINMFYKVLIALVVGGLGLHQLLNYMTLKREMRSTGV